MLIIQKDLMVIKARLLWNLEIFYVSRTKSLLYQDIFKLLPFSTTDPIL